MKLLITTIAAVVLVGCGESQQSAPAPEVKPAETVAEAAQPEPPSAKAPDISIHGAATLGNIEAVKQHLAAGTDVNAKDDDGTTPLHNAASGGRKEVVELLIAAGADMEAKDMGGLTPLHFSVNKEIAELLIANGANVNAKSDDGVAPLHNAAGNGHKGIVELLIAEGADVNAKLVGDGPHKGKTPLDVANETNRTEIVNLLRKHGGKTGEELK